jgi:subtilisin family serine protease
MLAVPTLSSQPAANARPPGSSQTADHGSTESVTLITGDKVEVTTLAGGRRVVRTIAGAGRQTGFIEREVDGRLSVIPADAAPLLAAGRLDPRLFDVTTQLAQKRDASSLIIQYGGSARALAQSGFTAAGAKVTRDLPGIKGAAIQVAPGKLWPVLKPSAQSFGVGISKIWLNGMRQMTLDQSVAQIGAPAAWAAGFTGAGVPVAVIDSGIDSGHPDLADRVRAAKDFTGTGAGDEVGHGTHVASTIAGTAAASAGKYKGVAFGAGLISAKACQPGGCEEADILAAMEWAAVEQHARVINLSLGAPDTEGTDPLELAVNTLTAQTGALFVISAGNAGPKESTLGSPGTADSALTVGAVDVQDKLAKFSSRGPRLGDHAIKPEITAPGVGIVAALAAGTSPGEVVDGRYVRLSGTSMAAPHVAGAAAILAQQHPDWKAADLKAALIASARSIGGSAFEVGSGRVDVAAAVKQALLPTPAILSFGVAEWPHDDDQPIVRNVAYRNTGSASVTVNLIALGNGPDGGPAPAGMFSVSPAQLTIPAGGSAEAVVTVTTREGADGTYSGRIVAKGGALDIATTPIGVIKEVESVNLALDVLDRNGERPGAQVLATNVDTGKASLLEVGGEPLKSRLPKGRYDLISPVSTAAGAAGDSISLVARPELNLDADTTVVLDARVAEPIRAVAVDARNAVPAVRRASVSALAASLTIGTDFPDFGIEVTPTGPVSYPYRYRQDISMTQPARLKRPKGYNLYFTKDALIPHPVFRVKDAELGRVESFAHSDATATGPATFSSDVPFGPDDEFSRPMGYDVTGPGKRYDFYTPGIRWDIRGRFAENHSEFGSPLAVQPGDHREEHWNAAVLRPRLFPQLVQNTFWAELWMASPASKDHYASDYADTVTGRTTLTRDRQLVATTDKPDGGFFDLPDGRATYELINEISRSLDWSSLSTKMSTRWKFTMDPALNSEPLALNLRIEAPAADLQNRLKRGSSTELVLTPEPTHSGSTATAASLSVSYDDGATWRPLRTRQIGDHFTALLPPASAEAAFISLRAKAEDAAGNEIEHTVIHAFGLS